MGQWFLQRCGLLASKDDVLELSNSEVTIGRSEEMTYCIISSYVSRIHAKFKEDNGTWKVKDCGSLNGIYINNGKLQANEEYPLSEGDIIGLGQPPQKMYDKKAYVYKLCIRPTQSGPVVQNCSNEAASRLSLPCVGCARNSTVVCQSNNSQFHTTVNSSQMSCVPPCLYAQSDHSNCKLLGYCSHVPLSHLRCANVFGCLGDRCRGLESCDNQVSLLRQPLLETCVQNKNNCVDSQKRTLHKVLPSSDEHHLGQHTSNHSCKVENEPSMGFQTPIESHVVDVRQATCSTRNVKTVQSPGCPSFETTSKETSSHEANQSKSKLSLASVRRHSADEQASSRRVLNGDKRGDVTGRVEEVVSVACKKLQKQVSCPDEIIQLSGPAKGHDHSTKEHEKEISLCETAATSTPMDMKMEDCALDLPQPIELCDSDDGNSNSQSPVLQPVRWLSLAQGNINQDQKVDDVKLINDSKPAPSKINPVKPEKFSSDEPIVISDDSSCNLSPVRVIKEFECQIASTERKMPACRIKLLKCPKCHSCHSQTVGCVIAGIAKLKINKETNKGTLVSSDSDDNSGVVRQQRRVRYKARRSFKMDQKRKIISSESDSDDNKVNRDPRPTLKRPISDSESENSKDSTSTRDQMPDGSVSSNSKLRSVFEIGINEKVVLQETGSTKNVAQPTTIIGSPSIPKRMVASLSRFMRKNADGGSLLSSLSKQTAPLNPSEEKLPTDVHSNFATNGDAQLLNHSDKGTSNSQILQASVKQEPSNPVAENQPVVLKCENDSDEEYGYTQDDEVILISDDEGQYFSSTQPKSGCVKSEPIWLDDDSWNSWARAECENKAVVHEQLSMLGINNLNFSGVDCNAGKSSEPIKATNSSTVEMQNSTTSPDDKLQQEDEQFFPELSQNFYAGDDCDNTNDEQFFPDLSQNFYKNRGNDDHSDEDDHTEDDTFFPELSQNFYNDAGSDHDLDADECPVDAEPQLPGPAKKSVARFYATKLTEPIPMVAKNKRDGVYYSRSNLKPKKTTKKDDQAAQKRSITPSITITPSNTTTKPQTRKRRGTVDSLDKLRKKVQKGLGNRIPIPGGGSAIPCPPIHLTTSKPPAKQVNKRSISAKLLSPPRPVASLANSALKPLELRASLQAGKSTRPKATAKTSNRAESRSAFLTELSKRDLELVRKNSAKNQEQKSKTNVQNLGNNQSGPSWKIPKAVRNEPAHCEPGPSGIDNLLVGDIGISNVDPLAVKKLQPSAKKVRFSDREETRYFEGTSKPAGKCQIARIAPLYSDESNVACPNLKPSFLYTLDDVLSEIVAWNPAWLEQQEHNEKPPPIIDYKKLWPTLLAYKSVDDYMQVYKPLLLLETWALITKDWKLSQPPHTMAVAIIETSKSQSKYGAVCANFTCQTLCTPQEMGHGLYPQEGQMFILDLVVLPAPSNTPPNLVTVKQILKVFAYVESITKAPYKFATNPSLLLANHPTANVENTTVVTCILKTKHRSVPINTNILMKVQVLSYLRPTMRQFQALFHLPRTILARDILQPRYRTCAMVPNPHMQLQVKGTFNQQQRDAILSVADACSQGSVPKICLLQGPPGTGKSHTTVGIVQQLLFGSDMKTKSGIHPKILLTAPSNSAIDELVIRLIKVKKLITPTRKFRIVRVGPINQVHPEVREYMLENLVRQNLDARLKDRNTTESVEQELRCLEAQSNALHSKLESVCLRKITDKVPTIRREIAEIQRKLERLQKQKNFCFPTMFDRRKEERQLMIEMLQGADIVATTLSSCRQNVMEEAFKDPRASFSSCIVDEATQCIEQLMLLPLMYGITKLILVGDPQQLPATVLSQKAMEFGLHQSLFERLYMNFRQNLTQNPVWMLTTQYRMHPEICRFPSKCFYDNRLETHGLLETKYRHNRFVPYILFDLQYVQEEGDISNGLVCNPREAEFIVNLISGILKHNELQLTLGIITPYQQQKQLLKNMLRTRFPAESNSIEVNTVDGFQGREKDLIILSTVRAKHASGSIGFLTHEKRLCVALTRAKQSFYICGHLSSLQVNSFWRALIHDARERGHVLDIRNFVSEDRICKYIIAR